MLLFGSCVWVRPVCRRNMACFGCSAVRLFGCSAELAEPAGRLRSGSPSPEMPVAVRRFCAVPGLNLLFGPAFRTCFSDPLSEPAFRVCFGLVPGLFRACFGSVPGLFRVCFGICFRTCFGICFRVRSGAVSGPAFRICFRGCRPDAGAILFDCGMWCVVPIRPQDSSV